LKNCSKTTVENFCYLPTVLFSKKTILQYKNPIWQEKFKMVAKNHDGIKFTFFTKKSTGTPMLSNPMIILGRIGFGVKIQDGVKTQNGAQKRKNLFLLPNFQKSTVLKNLLCVLFVLLMSWRNS
jgi:hypothetical protein